MLAEVSRGTAEQLASIGVSDGSPLVTVRYPDMPRVTTGSHWPRTAAYFKQEGPDLVNIGLGRGPALATFNQNIIEYHPVTRP